MSEEKIATFPLDKRGQPGMPVQDAKDWTSESMLSHVHNLVRTKQIFSDKAIVITIDCECGFHPNWYQSGMSSHEMIAALEMMKLRVMEQMK